ncbi:hypothetical protein GCM10025794_26280 [Massilia kyonggiensis]
MLILWFPRLINNSSSTNIFTKITICYYLINGLKPKLLIRTNIIYGKGFMLNFKHSIIIISSYS